MAYRDTEKFQDFTHFFQTWDEYALFADYCVRKFKATDGAPIRNAEDLESLSLRREEELVVRTVYDRFSPNVSPSNPSDHYDA